MEISSTIIFCAIIVALIAFVAVRLRGQICPREENDMSTDYIECGGLKWALQNTGTDTKNPNGKLYTFDGALTLENDTWRLPTRDEQEIFIDRTYYGFDEGRKSMTFVDRETGVKLEFPAVGYRSTSGTLYFDGTDGFYWSSTQGSSTGAYDMYFSSGNVSTGYNDKRVGFSVRLVRR